MPGFQHCGEQPPKRADNQSYQKTKRQIKPDRNACRMHQRRCGGNNNSRQQKLPVTAQIPDACTESDNQARCDQEKRSHTSQRCRQARRRQYCPFHNIGIVAQGIDAHGKKDQPS
ncbi:hypothetical protein D9M69_705510 [compost metagenome]